MCRQVTSLSNRVLSAMEKTEDPARWEPDPRGEPPPAASPMPARRNWILGPDPLWSNVDQARQV